MECWRGERGRWWCREQPTDGHGQTRTDTDEHGQGCGGGAGSGGRGRKRFREGTEGWATVFPEPWNPVERAEVRGRRSGKARKREEGSGHR